MSWYATWFLCAATIAPEQCDAGKAIYILPSDHRFATKMECFNAMKGYLYADPAWSTFMFRGPAANEVLSKMHFIKGTFAFRCNWSDGAPTS